MFGIVLSVCSVTNRIATGVGLRSIDGAWAVCVCYRTAVFAARAYIHRFDGNDVCTGRLSVCSLMVAVDGQFADLTLHRRMSPVVLNPKSVSRCQ